VTSAAATVARDSAAAAADATPREVRLELLVGRKVYDAAGQCIGRVEEVRAEVDGADYVVREFHVGKLAVLERLLDGRLLRALVRRLSGGRLWRGYAVPWRDMELSDPERPRVRRREAELEKLDA
jgi:sporulation protein YlmC with PRC-barrel domain